jgi:AcrR family transcriptional regulator
MASDIPEPVGSETDRLVNATLRLIAEQGWRRLSMAAIAAEAGLPILTVYRLFPSKQAILCAFSRRIDETVLAAPPEANFPGADSPGADSDERPRVRVFDLLMRRFDALGPHRDALAVLSRELPGDPIAALTLGAGLLRSMVWMLEASGIATDGLRGAIAVKLTASAYAATLRVWQRDDSPDLGQTMAALDRRLRGIERWLGSARRRRHSASGGTAASPA